MEFNTIYEKHHNEIVNFLTRNLNCKQDAEDLASEVFIKVNNNLNSFDGKFATVRTWVWSIAKNALIDHFRKRRLSLESLDKTFNDDDSNSNNMFIPVTASDPQKDMEANEMGNEILDALVELPSSISNVAELYFIDEFTYEEIADDLSVPMGTVKAHIYRARKLLQNRLMAFR